jgi:hypothetical protein
MVLVGVVSVWLVVLNCLWGRDIAQQSNWRVILRDGRGIKDGLGLDPLSTLIRVRKKEAFDTL